MANTKKQPQEPSTAPLDVTLLDFYAAPIVAAIAAVEWGKGKGGTNHLAIAAHAVRQARAVLVEREKPFLPHVVSEGKKEASRIELPIEEVPVSPEILAPDGSVARTVPATPSTTPPSPFNPQTDLTKLKELADLANSP